MGNRVDLPLLETQIQHLNAVLSQPKLISLLENTHFMVEECYKDRNKHMVSQNDPNLIITLSFIHKKIKYFYKQLSYQELVQLKDLIYNLEKSTDCKKQDQECAICLNNSMEIILECSHGFCGECTKQWIIDKQKNTCPMCRFIIQDEDVIKNSYFLDTNKQVQELIIQEVFRILHKL